MRTAWTDGATERRTNALLFQTCCILAALLATWVAEPHLAAAESSTVTNAFLSQPLSRADTINLALRQNPSILRAQKDLAATQGVVIQTRAIVVPKVQMIGNFTATAPGDVDKAVDTPTGFSFGTDQAWRTQLKLTQSIYEGGRMASALRVARLTQEQSWLNYETTVADTVLAVQIAYDDVLLAEQQIIVQEASVELLGRELSDTTRRFEAGTVPRFNVLRAEVELANARPKLIRARNSFRIAKNNLAVLLGMNVPRETLEDIPLLLSEKLVAEPFDMGLPRAVGTALEQRTELGSLRKAVALRKEGVVNAQGGYKPSLQVFGGYDAHSSLFNPDLAYQLHGWITGVQLSWDIFDGMRSQGKVKEATALYDRAGLELDDTGRRIVLEVRTSYSYFIEAREVLDSQKKVVEQAEESLRLARARSDAGTGTQLDVLSAQTALTEARSTQVQALHDYSVARERLERAIGSTVAKPEPGAVK